MGLGLAGKLGSAWVVDGDGAWVHAWCMGFGKGGGILLSVESQCYTFCIGEAGLGCWALSGLSGGWQGGG